MRIFGVLVLLLVLVIGIGFYRGWFSMSSQTQNPVNNNAEMGVTVDRDKIEADAEAVKEKARELTGEAKEKASELVPKN